MDEPTYGRMPERLYVERWPDEADREDCIHYEPTGYGVDMRTGAASQVTVYVREDIHNAQEAPVAELEAYRRAFGPLIASARPVRCLSCLNLNAKLAAAEAENERLRALHRASKMVEGSLRSCSFPERRVQDDFYSAIEACELTTPPAPVTLAQAIEEFQKAAPDAFTDVVLTDRVDD